MGNPINFSKSLLILSTKRNDGFEDFGIYCSVSYGARLYYFKTVRADFKANCRLSEFARSLDEQRQKTIIVRRDVIRGSDWMGFSAGGGCGRPATIKIMPPRSTMTATSTRTATMSTTITMLSAPHCSHMVWSFCVGTQSPCREQRNRILSRIFGKTYVGGRDNAKCFMLLRRENGCARRSSALPMRLNYDRLRKNIRFSKPL